MIITSDRYDAQTCFAEWNLWIKTKNPQAIFNLQSNFRKRAKHTSTKTVTIYGIQHFLSFFFFCINTCVHFVVLKHIWWYMAVASHKVPCARDNTREKRKEKRMPCWSLPRQRWGKESDHRPSWRKPPVHVTLYWQWHSSVSRMLNFGPREAVGSHPAWSSKPHL